MSIQLSESCVRSLYNTTRIRSYAAAFRLARSCPLRVRPDVLQHNKVDRHPIHYTTLALKSHTTPDDMFVDSKTRFDSHLQQPKSILELWNAYLAIRSKASVTTPEYEQLMTHLLSRAQETRKSVNWQRMARVYGDAPQHSKKMMRMGITAYGRTGQFDKAYDVFNQAKEQGWADQTVVGSMVDAALNTGRHEEARRVILDGKRGMDQATLNRCLDRYIDVCIKKKNVARAMAMVQESVPNPSERVTSLLFTGYTQLMKRSGARVEEGVDLETFVSAFGQCRTMSLPHSTQILFGTSHLATLMDAYVKNNGALSPKTYQELLAMYAADGDLAGMTGVVADMKQQGMEPTQRMVNALLKTSKVVPPYAQALLKTSNRENKLRKEGYAAFIQAFVNAGDVDSAQRVARQMKRRPYTIGMSSHMAIVQGWVRQGQAAKAEAWLDEVKYAKAVRTQCQAALDPYAVVLEGYLQNGDWNRCVALVDAIQQQAPMAQQNRRIVKAVVAARLARGDFDGGEHMLAHKQIEFTPVTVARITQTLLDLKVKSMHSVSGYVAVRGLELMEGKLNIQVGAVAVSRLIEKLGERGDVRAAYDLYKRAKTQHAQPVYRAMMDAAIKNNNTAMAERVGYHMAQMGAALSSYNMLMNAYASRKPEPHLVRMTGTFRRMLAEGYKPDKSTYNTLIKAFVQKDNLDAAHSVFKEMVKAGHQPDGWTVNTIIQGYVSQLDWHGVAQFVGQVKESGHRLDIVTFNLMLEGLLQLDRHGMQAMKLLKRQNCWSKLKKHPEPSHPLPSATVWEIFESTVGLAPQTASYSVKALSVRQACDQLLQQQQKRPLVLSEKGAFFTLFGLAQPDEVTFKLFMKAFQYANDPESAVKIQQYWTACR